MKKRVLFLCKGNSARSQMAEALLRHHAGDKFAVFSAGTQPEPVDTRALKALNNFGVSIENLNSKNVSAFDDTAFDFVIALYDKSSKNHNPFTVAREQIAWHFEDPRRRHGVQPFEATLKEINERLKMFLLIQAKEERKSDQAIGAS